MSMKDVRNKVHRNGFDLSFRNSFTAKIGELLPVMCKEVLPGDKFNIDLASMVRTQPVKTAAFTRLKEYYDFYFVPTSLLWDKFDNFIVQTNNYNHARGFTLSPENLLMHPYFTAQELWFVLKYLYARRGDNTSDASSHSFDVCGYSAFDKCCKLLQYLGYGNWSDFFGEGAPFTDSLPDWANVSYNPFPLLGYQKICQDHFRYDAWQTSRPYLFNLDYIFSSGNLRLPLMLSYIPSGSPLFDKFSNNDTIFSLNYCSYRKDLFTGLLPRAQFGDVSVASPLSGKQRFDFTLINPTSSGDLKDGFIASVSSKSYNEINGGYDYNTGLGLSVFALRFAEATQKYREITQSGNLDFKTQLEKHWNVKVSDYQSYMSRWLGGTGSNININEVTNNNLVGDEQAVLAGKGFSTNQKNGVLHFDSKEYGYLYCIYHAEPVLDWDSSGCERHNVKHFASDYAIPEFDNLGMESVPAVLLVNTPIDQYGAFRNPLPKSKTLPIPVSSIGYAPRYYDYKQSLDVVRGSYLTINKDWVSPLSRSKFANITGSVSSTDGAKALLTYSSFLVNPNCVNTIFLTQADGTVDSDVLLNSVFFDIKAVRNLSVSGLPY